MPDYANYKPIESYYRTKGRYTWIDPVTGEQVESTMQPPESREVSPETTGYSYSPDIGYKYINPLSGGISTSLTQPELTGGGTFAEFIHSQIGQTELNEDIYWRSFPKAALERTKKEHFKQANLEIDEEFSESVKIANAYRGTDDRAYASLMQDAEELKKYKKTELMTQYARLKNNQRLRKTDLRLTDDDRLQGDLQDYMQKPFIEIKEPEKLTYAQEMDIQQALGKLATDTEFIEDRESAVALASQLLGFDFAQKFPQAMEIIDKRAQLNWSPLLPEGVPEEEVPITPKKTWGWPTLFKPAYRVRPEQPAASSAQMQSAPDVALDPYWSKLSEQQKKDVWTQFQKNPNATRWILRMLENAED